MHPGQDSLLYEQFILMCIRFVCQQKQINLTVAISESQFFSIIAYIVPRLEANLTSKNLNL